LLLDPGVARSRRVAARPPHRAQRALPIGNVVAWDSRTLAYAMTVEADQGIAALRSGAVLQWVRRGLGDAAIAARLEDVVRARMPDAPTEEPRTDAVTLMG